MWHTHAHITTFSFHGLEPIARQRRLCVAYACAHQHILTVAHQFMEPRTTGHTSDPSQIHFRLAKCACTIHLRLFIVRAAVAICHIYRNALIHTCSLPTFCPDHNQFSSYLRAGCVCNMAHLLQCSRTYLTDQHLVCIPWLPPFLSLGRGAVYIPCIPIPFPLPSPRF